MATLKQLIDERVLILDGAMGTMTVSYTHLTLPTNSRV